MDKDVLSFVEFVERHELEHYLSSEGLALVAEIRRKADEDRYEAWLDECEEMGVDREFARSISNRRLPPKAD